MRVLMVLPALTEAKSPLFRPIKYSLFPPLGLATLAAHLSSDDEVRLVDEHVMPELSRTEPIEPRPDLAVIQVYITSASRSYALADSLRKQGVYVVLGGLHPTSLPEEASAHADTIFLGPGDATFPQFLKDFRAGQPLARYDSKAAPRTIERIPPIRRDLIDRGRYFVPNSIVVTRGCPHHCDFCYKDAFFAGGRSFYTQHVDDALAEIDRLPGRHLYFLDDHLLGHPRFASELFEGMRGMGRVFQGASTVDAVLRGDLIEKAVDAGLRSLFLGFETLRPESLLAANKPQNIGRSYDECVRRLDDLGVMINGSFVFGIDGDPPDTFDSTVEWAVSRGLTTATFHVATPYPGTRLFQKIETEGRLCHRDWERYDTRQAVFEPVGMSRAQLESGYKRAYRKFYEWSSIARASKSHASWKHTAKHFAYSGGWKKSEFAWNLLIRTGLLGISRPALEAVLSKVRTQPRQTTPSSSTSLTVLQ